MYLDALADRSRGVADGEHGFFLLAVMLGHRQPVHYLTAFVWRRSRLFFSQRLWTRIIGASRCSEGARRDCNARRGSGTRCRRLKRFSGTTAASFLQMAGTERHEKKPSRSFILTGTISPIGMS